MSPFKLRVDLNAGIVEITPNQEEVRATPPEPPQKAGAYRAVVEDDPTNNYFHQVAGQVVVVQGDEGGFLSGVFLESGLPFSGWAPNRVRRGS
jgi:hypothetical protein